MVLRNKRIKKEWFKRGRGRKKPFGKMSLKGR